MDFLAILSLEPYTFLRLPVWDVELSDFGVQASLARSSHPNTWAEVVAGSSEVCCCNGYNASIYNRSLPDYHDLNHAKHLCPCFCGSGYQTATDAS